MSDAEYDSFDPADLPEPADPEEPQTWLATGDDQPPIESSEADWLEQHIEVPVQDDDDLRGE